MTHSDSAIRRREISNYVKDGHTLSEAMEHFQVTMTTVRAACIQNGVSVFKGKKPVFKILKFIFEKKEDVEIAKLCGVSRQYVGHIRKEASEAGLLDANT